MLFCHLKIMTIRMKILLFILFASTATSLAHSNSSFINYDITFILNISIARTFNNLNSDTIQRLLLFKLDNTKPINHDIEFDYDLEPFRNKFYFTGVNISIDFVSESLVLRHEFSSFETTIFIPELEFVIEGYLGSTNDTDHSRFACYVNFKNVSISTFKISPHVHTESKLYFNMKYDENFECDFLHLALFRQNMTSETRVKLKQIIRKAAPLLFLENLQHNEMFSRSLDIRLCNHAEKETGLLFPAFHRNSENYHYLIPNITSIKRTLSNITICGLWNFQSFSVKDHFGQIVRNLTIKNIRGHANLFYDSRNSKIFPLRFEVGFLSIIVDEEMQRVGVTTYNYSVSQIDLNSSLTEYQSKWVMGGIELAIASSIMPSIKFDRNWNVSSNTRKEHPIVEISSAISHVFQTKFMRELHDGLNISLSKEMTAEASIRIFYEYYNISMNYTTSFPTVPVNPYMFRCTPYSSIEMYYKIPWFVHGYFHFSNSDYKFSDIRFSLDQISIELIINENNNYRLLAYPNINPDQSTINKQKDISVDRFYRIMDIVEQMLARPILEKFRPFVKSLLSIPHLDYCTTPVNMFDDFLPFFADHELPYFVPDTNAVFNTDRFFTSKINNVTITEWTMYPFIFVEFDRDNDEKILSKVSTRLENVKVRMSLTNSSFPSEELELGISRVCIANQTSTGKIKVEFDMKNNFTLLKYEEDSLKRRLECMIEESFKTSAKKE